MCVAHCWGYEPEKQALPSFRRLSNGRNALDCKSLERNLLLVHLILSAVPVSFVLGTTVEEMFDFGGLWATDHSRLNLLLVLSNL